MSKALGWFVIILSAMGVLMFGVKYINTPDDGTFALMLINGIVLAIGVSIKVILRKEGQ